MPFDNKGSTQAYRKLCKTKATSGAFTTSFSRSSFTCGVVCLDSDLLRYDERSSGFDSAFTAEIEGFQEVAEVIVVMSDNGVGIVSHGDGSAEIGCPGDRGETSACLQAFEWVGESSAKSREQGRDVGFSAGSRHFETVGPRARSRKVVRLVCSGSSRVRIVFTFLLHVSSVDGTLVPALQWIP